MPETKQLDKPTLVVDGDTIVLRLSTVTAVALALAALAPQFYTASDWSDLSEVQNVGIQSILAGVILFRDKLIESVTRRREP